MSTTNNLLENARRRLMGLTWPGANSRPPHRALGEIDGNAGSTSTGKIT
jgi:hypothetical protein